MPPIIKAKDEQARPTSVADAVGAIGYGAGSAIAIVTMPLAVPLVLVTGGITYSAVEHVQDHPSLVAQEKLQIGMTVAKVSELMGMPTDRFFLEPAHTEVWSFKRSEQNNALWIGFVDNQLIWLRYTIWYDTNWHYDWLTALTTRSLKATEISR